MGRRKIGFFRVLILVGIIGLCGLLYFKHFKADKGLRVTEWDNIYNENNISLFYEDINNKSANLAKLDKTYNVSNLITKSNSELDQALQTIDIVNSIVNFDDVQDSLANDAYGILSEKGENKKVSDRDMAIIERDMLLTAGFKSRVGEFRKEKPQFQKKPNYYVVEFWSTDYNKWIMLNFKDRGYLEKSGVPLSSIEVLGESLKKLTYMGKSSQNEFRSKFNGYNSSYSIAIDNTLAMKKSNTYITYCSSKKDIDMKVKNSSIPSTIYTTEKQLFTMNPNEVPGGKDSKAYIVIMKKPMESSQSYSYVLGAFQNGSIVKDYYLRVNDDEMQKVDKYKELELAEGTNKIELSLDGNNVISKIVIERDK